MRTNSFFRPRVRLFPFFPERRGARRISFPCMRLADLAYMVGHALARVHFSPSLSISLPFSPSSSLHRSPATLHTHAYMYICMRAVHLLQPHTYAYVYHARVQLVLTWLIDSARVYLLILCDVSPYIAHPRDIDSKWRRIDERILPIDLSRSFEIFSPKLYRFLIYIPFA